MDWEAEGLLDGCDGQAREARRALLDKLHADGVRLEELRQAVAEERLALVPVERLLISESRYSAREACRELLDMLHADGVRLEELRQAVAEERLALVPVERLLISESRYSARDVAEQSGLDLEFFEAQRRALGLAVPGSDERVYGE